jgi:hypothetical protein
MNSRSTRTLLALLGAVLALSAQAGTVEVSYDASKPHTDAGALPPQREERLAALAAHLRALGERRLPAGQTLQVEIVDLDLTGRVQMSKRTLAETRVVTGRADGPRIQLRYSLRDAGATLASGEDSLHDAALPRLGEARDSGGGDPLRSEKALLDRWFEERFGKAP